jgi:hypothetical protein
MAEMWRQKLSEFRRVIRPDFKYLCLLDDQDHESSSRMNVIHVLMLGL